MTHLTQLFRQSPVRSAPHEQAVGGPGLHWIVAILSLWMIGGIHLDAWAHHQFEMETFFTPWHSVLYSGFFALAAVLIVTLVINLWRGYGWLKAMPVGYGLSLLGVALFFAGGLGDMLWHIVFGIEENVEALLSPTHLLLAFGGALIVTGPVRAAWAKRGTDRPTPPALISLSLLLAVLAFFTAYANPLSDAVLAQGSRPTTEEGLFLTQGVGVAGILIQTALMMGVVLLAVRRWTLSFGSLTLMLGLSGLLTISVHEDWRLAGILLISGLIGDALIAWWRPSVARSAAFRSFAFTLPVIFYALYFATLALTGGIWWSIHLWTGAIGLAGVVGWLLSYAFVPPIVVE